MAVTYDELIPVSIVHGCGHAFVALEYLDGDLTQTLTAQRLVRRCHRELRGITEHLVELMQESYIRGKIGFDILGEATHPLRLLSQFLDTLSHQNALRIRCIAERLG